MRRYVNIRIINVRLNKTTFQLAKTRKQHKSIRDNKTSKHNSAISGNNKTLLRYNSTQVIYY